MFSTWNERHSFLTGFFEVLCPWPARTWLSGEYLNILLGEYHYYMAGRALGLPIFVLILIALAKLIKEVIL